MVEIRHSTPLIQRADHWSLNNNRRLIVSSLFESRKNSRSIVFTTIQETKNRKGVERMPAIVGVGGFRMCRNSHAPNSISGFTWVVNRYQNPVDKRQDELMRITQERKRKLLKGIVENVHYSQMKLCNMFLPWLFSKDEISELIHIRYKIWINSEICSDVYLNLMHVAQSEE